MDQLIIQGGTPLTGEVMAAGNKNAALPLLAATLLTAEPVILRNVPSIGDVETMRELLCSLGVEVDEVESHTWRVHARDFRRADLDRDLCRRIRASFLLAGPMLARTGQVELPPPGGDVIGRRRLDTHLLAFEAMGVESRFNGMLLMRHAGLHGSDILLDEASVTGTENAIMAAVRASGKTVLRNAASEPHVQELCHMLTQMGARISGIGSNTLHIEGVSELHGTEFTVGPDYLEVVSLIGAAAVTGGEIRIRNAGPQYLEMIRLVFRRLGVRWDVEGADIVVPSGQSLTIVPDFGGAIPEVKVNVWPAFPTDLMSIAIVVATQAAGTVLFHDWMYPSRMYFVDKLVGMGARITLCDPHRCLVQGPDYLQGEKLESPDIRAGMAMLIAALCARGTSIIRNIGQIDRGYEQIERKLASLGARIERVAE